MQAMLDVERQQLKDAKSKIAEQDAQISDLQKSVAALNAKAEQKAKEEAKRLAEKGERKKIKELARKQKEEEEKRAQAASAVNERKRNMEESRKRQAEEAKVPTLHLRFFLH